MRRVSRAHRVRTTASLAAVAVVVGLAAGTAGANTPPLGSRPLPALRTAAKAIAAGTALKLASSSVLAQLKDNEYAWLPQSTCLETAITSTDATPCVLGATTTARSIVLFGDSSADQWALDLGQLGTRFGFRVVVYVHAACPVGAIVVGLYGKGVDPSCATFRKDVLSDLATMRPQADLVVLSELRLPNYVTATGGRLSNAAWSAALTRTVATLVRGDGDAVALLHGVAVSTLDPAQCIAANPNAVTACNTQRARSDPAGYDAAAWHGAAAGHAAGVDAVPLFCTATLCPAVSQGKVTHSGVDHVTESYAADVVAALGELLGCASLQPLAHASRARAVLGPMLGPRDTAVLRACRSLPR